MLEASSKLKHLILTVAPLEIKKREKKKKKPCWTLPLGSCRLPEVMVYKFDIWVMTAGE